MNLKYIHNQETNLLYMATLSVCLKTIHFRKTLNSQLKVVISIYLVHIHILAYMILSLITKNFTLFIKGDEVS